jgi:hypothetical protein
MPNSAATIPDEALSKGAEEDSPDRKGRPQTDALATQLGHRDQNDMLKENDTDFPEPNAEAEHTGK